MAEFLQALFGYFRDNRYFSLFELHGKVKNDVFDCSSVQIKLSTNPRCCVRLRQVASVDEGAGNRIKPACILG